MGVGLITKGNVFLTTYAPRIIINDQKIDYHRMYTQLGLISVETELKPQNYQTDVFPEFSERARRLLEPEVFLFDSILFASRLVTNGSIFEKSRDTFVQDSLGHDPFGLSGQIAFNSDVSVASPVSSDTSDSPLVSSVFRERAGLSFAFRNHDCVVG